MGKINSTVEIHNVCDEGRPPVIGKDLKAGD
jgi:hypothetical protein